MKLRELDEVSIRGIDTTNSVLALLAVIRIANHALTDMTDTREYEVQYLTALEAIMDVEIDV